MVKPTLITRPGGAPRVTYTYDAAGNLTGKVYHDADDLDRELKTAYSYDARWRLQQQDHSWDLDPVSSSDIYTRDNGGRITERNSTLLDGDAYDHTYTYDNAGRLLTADVDHNLVPWKSEAYDVDSIARRTQTTKTGVVAGYTYAPLPTSATNAPTDVVPSVNGEILTDDQTYNRDGALNYRYLRPQGTAPTTPFSKEWFFYGYNDRVVKLQTTATLEPAVPTCMVPPPISLSRATKTEWQYSYSPSGEREIKRLVRSPKTDSTCGSVYPWTYYLLGTSDEQQVVYHGRQISRADCDEGGIGRRVFFYPVEYRSYGVDGVNIVWERDDNGTMVARFVGTDVQGSERYAVGKNAYQKVRDYLPFGVDVAVANDQRRGYLGKESDYETAPRYGVVHAGLYHERLVDMSARKYSKTQGAFTSVDALWAGQINYSPYSYAFHNPINFMDPSGYAGTPIGGGGSGTSGGTTGTGGKKLPKWAQNIIMIDDYSSDESRAMKAESQLHRDVRKFLLSDQQPQSTSKKAQPTTASNSATFRGPTLFNVFTNPVGTAWDYVVTPAWNSPIARYFVPDINSLGVGFTGIWPIGGGASFDLNWIVRGPDASIVPIVTTSVVTGVGLSADATFNMTSYNVLAPVDQIKKELLETSIEHGDVDYWLSVGASALGKVGAGLSVSKTKGGPFVVGRNVSVGVGMPFLDLPLTITAGASNTFILDGGPR